MRKSLFAMVAIIVIPLGVVTAALPTVNLIVPPPGARGVEELWQAWVVSDTECTAWFEGYVYAEGVGQVFFAKTNPFALTRGRKKYQYRDVTTEKTESRNGYEGFVTRFGIPAGVYDFVLLLKPFDVGDSSHVVVKPIGPPPLVSPRNGDTVKTKNLQFVWGRSPGAVGPVSYDIRIVDVPTGLTKEEAMTSRLPWFEQRDIRTTSLTYPISARALDDFMWGNEGNDVMWGGEGTDFAWRVTATTANGQTATSEVRTFTRRPAAFYIPPDLWMMDSPEDVGNEPNMETPIVTFKGWTGRVLWESPDIWVAKETPDRAIVGYTTAHQYSIYADAHVSDKLAFGGAKSIRVDVYVEVRNRGGKSFENPNVKLRLYYADASTGLTWPSSFAPPNSFCGEVIPGGVVIPPLAPGESWVWKVDNWQLQGLVHCCFLARIEEAPAYPHGMTNSEQHNDEQYGVGWNTQYNNNVAWHNVTVASDEGGKYSFFAKPGATGSRKMSLGFQAQMLSGAAWDDTTVVVDLGKELFELWARGDSGSGVRRAGGTSLRLTADTSYIKVNNIEPGRKYQVDVDVPAQGPDVLRIAQWADDPRPAGGVTIKRQGADGLGRTGGGGRCQLPIWVFPNLKAVDFTTGTPIVTSLSKPQVTQGQTEYPTNGWCGQCGGLLFYIQDCTFFGSWGPSGIDNTMLSLCPGHELAICPVPGRNGRYYVFYYANGPVGYDPFYGDLCYSVVDQSFNDGQGGLDPGDPLGVRIVPHLNGRGHGLALSRPINPEGDRWLYFARTDAFVQRLTIGSAVDANSLTQVANHALGLGEGYALSQLELSHDGRRLAGTIYSANAHYPDVVYVMGLKPDGTYDGDQFFGNKESFVVPSGASGAARFICRGVTFAPPDPQGKERLFFSMSDRNNAANQNNGIYWVELGVNGTPQLIPGTKAYCKSQLELAYPGDRYIYAAKADGIAGIDVTLDPPQLDPSTFISGITAANNYDALNLQYLQYLLPDQIDGEMYNSGDGLPADLLVRDGPDDYGSEPNTVTQSPWESPDIWVADPNTMPPRTPVSATYPHNYPIYPRQHVSDPVSSASPLDLYVMVRNRGCATSQQTLIDGLMYPQLKLYWADATTGTQNSWTDDWNQIPIGNGDAAIPPLDPGECWTFKLPGWTSPPSTIGHFCFQVQIFDAPDVPTLLPGSSTGDNTLNYNNIVWHNVEVQGKGGGKYSFFAKPDSAGPRMMYLGFQTQMDSGATWNDTTVVVDLGRELFELWARGDSGTGVRRAGGTSLRLTAASSQIAVNNVEPGRKYRVDVDVPAQGPDILRIRQWADDPRKAGGVTIMRQGADGRTMGGATVMPPDDILDPQRDRPAPGKRPNDNQR